MKAKYKLLVFALVFSLGIVACGSSGGKEAPTAPLPPTDTPLSPTEAPPTKTVPPPTDTLLPTPTTVPPTDTPSPSPTSAPASCNPNQIVENLSADLPREQFVFIYSGAIALGQEAPALTLSVWTIDYLINPQPGDDADATLNRTGRALESALYMVKHFEDADPCVDEVFASINPIIVDRNYNGWLSFEITTGVLPEKIDLNDKAFRAIMDKHVTLSYVRTVPPAPTDSPPADACLWETVRQNLEEQFGSSSNGNTRFFFVRDDHGNNVWAYLDSDEVTMFTNYLDDYVEQILDAIECLYPVPDNLIVHTVKDGIVLFSQRLPRAGIENRDLSRFVPFP